MDSYDVMAKALAERNRQNRRIYTIMIPFAIAALIAAILLRVAARSPAQLDERTTAARWCLQVLVISAAPQANLWATRPTSSSTASTAPRAAHRRVSCSWATWPTSI
jgi:hypothetical protein